MSVECGYVGKTITNITNEADAVVTAVAHGLETGDVVIITDVVGMEELNGETFTITVLTADTFSIGYDTSDSGGGVYISGGEVGYYECDRTVKACVAHENVERFGGYHGMVAGGVTIV